MPWAVLLTGDHVGLARGELEAQCGPVHWLAPRIGLTDAAPDDIRRIAHLREAGPYQLTGPLDVAAAHAQAPPGSIAVAGTALDGASTRAAQRSIGGALAAYHRVDLQGPDHPVFAWLHDGRVTVGLRKLGAWQDFAARALEQRAHFSPVSLRPRLAAALLHLTGCKPGQTVYDPFCGTGGIVLEAALEGYRAMGSDRDPWMVQGTLATLADAGPEPLDGVAFEADIGDAAERVGLVDGIATDLPYGGASTSNHEALEGLYGRALAAFALMLPAGAKAVVGHAAIDLPDPESHGFVVEAVHEEFVHKSLTRRFAVLTRTGRVD